MQEQDVLLQLCSRLDNQSLELLSKTTLWLIIREFVQGQYFWYLRTQYLLGRTLKQRSRQNWKIIYYLLESAITLDNPFYSGQVISVSILVDILLEAGYDPSAGENYAILLACKHGYTESVKILLSDPRIDPSANKGYCIGYASSYGYTDIVKLLLADPRVDPTMDNNFAIGHASAHGYTEVVKLLLADPRVDPTVSNNFALGWARRVGHWNIVELLEQWRKNR